MNVSCRQRLLFLAALSLAGSAMAQQLPPSASSASDRWSVPVQAASSPDYRDAMEQASNDAKRFHFKDADPKDDTPPEPAVRVIINTGHGPNVNCMPMGASGACH